MEFKRIDFHIHSEFSNDCILKIEKILEKTEKENFIIAIADHNEISGYLKSQKLKQKDRVIPAIETTSSEGIHILFYFTNNKKLIGFYKEIILPNKTDDLFRLNISALDLIKKGRKHNAFVGIPHPFVKTVGLLNNKKIKNSDEYLKLADFYEIYGGSSTKSINKRAIEFYDKNLKNKPIIVGSDAHFLKEVGNVLLEVNNFKNFKELFRNLRGENFVKKNRFKISKVIAKEIILLIKSNKKRYFKCRISRLFK